MLCTEYYDTAGCPCLLALPATQSLETSLIFLRRENGSHTGICLRNMVCATAIVPLEFAKNAITKGDFIPSVASSALEKMASEPSSTRARESFTSRPRDDTVSTLGTSSHGLVKNPDAMGKYAVLSWKVLFPT
ncbi:hypothetical protein D9758_011882 [Tetrapyrgos nigripes]|uniref:Uncharacterized protein n=1 Tax=Tetrapyrgos nigripes TaxID=182062 RepID=A0A8H5FR95_9AGAR|nr:hypothetical protein D9758_011882 [Tetrapyrgos nigripes]